MDVDLKPPSEADYSCQTVAVMIPTTNVSDENYKTVLEFELQTARTQNEHSTTVIPIRHYLQATRGWGKSVMNQ